MAAVTSLVHLRGGGGEAMTAIMPGPANKVPLLLQLFFVPILFGSPELLSTLAGGLKQCFLCLMGKLQWFLLPATWKDSLSSLALLVALYHLKQATHSS